MGGVAKEPIDYIRVILLAIGLGFFTLAVIKGQDWDWWNRKTVLSFVISIAWLIAFVAREVNCEYPILDVSLFKIKEFYSYTISLHFRLTHVV